jgi:hypothetical protein
MPVITRSQAKKNASASYYCEPISPDQTQVYVTNLLAGSENTDDSFLRFKRVLSPLIADALVVHPNKYVHIRKLYRVYRYVTKHIEQIYSEFRTTLPGLKKLLLVIYRKSVEFDKELNRYRIRTGYECLIDKFTVQLYVCRQKIRPFIEKAYNTQSENVADVFNHIEAENNMSRNTRKSSA